MSLYWLPVNGTTLDLRRTASQNNWRLLAVSKSSRLEANRWRLESRHSQPLAFNFLGSLLQCRSYDGVVEGLLYRSKRVIPVEDDKTRHAVR